MPNYNYQPTPEEEKITHALDELYPRAKSKTIVEYNGKIVSDKIFSADKKLTMARK